MQSYINERVVKRNARLGRIMVFGGLGAMVIGVLISLQQPYPVNLVFGLLFLGMIASQIGFPLRNRWDREPRIDQVLDEHLKGLDQRFVVFHYFLGASHALVSPAGLFAVIPRFEDGVISYSDGEWQRTLQRRGLLRRGGTRLIRGLSRETEAEIERLRKHLRRALDPPQIQPLIVFVHSQASLELSGFPLPVSHLKKLKSTLRKLPKAATLTQSQVNDLALDLGLA
jgi:hypothetical protein